MPQGVSCSVSNCSFWDEGNRCGAREILIEIDAHSKPGRLGQEEFAEELSGEHHDRAKKSSETCCLTFRPRASEA